MAARRRAPKWAKRRGTPRWARVLSWIMGAVIWLWVLINGTQVSDWSSASALANADTELLVNVLFFAVVATVLAVAAMFLVRLIGRALD